MKVGARDNAGIDSIWVWIEDYGWLKVNAGGFRGVEVTVECIVKDMWDLFIDGFDLKARVWDINGNGVEGSGHIDGLVEAIVKAIIEAIVALVEAVVEVASKVFEWIWDAIKSIIDIVINAILTALRPLAYRFFDCIVLCACELIVYGRISQETAYKIDERSLAMLLPFNPLFTSPPHETFMFLSIHLCHLVSFNPRFTSPPHETACSLWINSNI